MGLFIYSWLLLIPPLVCGELYQAFLFVGYFPNKEQVMIGNLMLVFFLTFGLHRFYLQQYIFNSISLLSLFLFAAFGSGRQSDFLFLTIGHLTSILVAIYFRREFVANLYDRHNSLSMLVPRSIATFLTTSEGKTQMTEAFSPRNRFTVCLCADWRNFQELSQTKSANDVSALLENFYDVVLDHLEKAVPDGKLLRELGR